MKLLNLKIIFFWFIIGLSYCLPLSILANSDCKEAFPTVEEFRQIIEEKGIRTQRAYKRRRQIDPELQRFPSEPARQYENFTWPGRIYVTAENLPPFEEFRQIIEEKGIRTQGEYIRQRQIDPELRRFPFRPEKIYKGFTWLGKTYVTAENLPPFEEFQQIIEEKGIRTRREYERQRQIDPELRRFPSEPARQYENFTWLGRTYVTDENLPPFEEFLKVIEQKGIKTRQEYERQRQIDPELRRFPSEPHKRYEDFTWSGKTRVTAENLPPFEEFQQIIEQKGIRSRREYIRQRRIDPELKRFPSEPHRRYEDFTWPGKTRVTDENLPLVKEFPDFSTT